MADTSTRDSATTAPGQVRVIGTGPLADELSEALRRRGAEVVGADDVVDGLDAMVFAPWDPTVVRPVPLVELTDDDFDQAWQQTMDAAVAACVAAREDFGGHGGRIVLTTPDHGLRRRRRVRPLGRGGRGRAPARQVRGPAVGARRHHRERPGRRPRPGARRPRRGRPGVDRRAGRARAPIPADVLAFLCSPAAADLAGQTLTVDGGLWM